MQITQLKNYKKILGVQKAHFMGKKIAKAVKKSLLTTP